MRDGQTFLIHPQHELAVDAVTTVKELIRAKVKYGIIIGNVRNGERRFQIALPTERQQPMAVGLKRWLKTYINQ